MEYCSNCGKPCDRSHPAAVQSLWEGNNNHPKTKYLCKKCAEQSAATQAFFFKYLIMPIALIAGVIYGIVWLVREIVTPLCTGTLGLVEPTVTYVQYGVGGTLSLIAFIIAFKIILKPWRRMKWYWQLILVLLIWPLIILPVAQLIFWTFGKLWGLVRGKR